MQSPVGGTVGVGGISSTLLTSWSTSCLCRVVDLKSESGEVNIAVTPDEKRTKPGLSQNIQDAIEDSLRVGRNDISTFTQTLTAD